MKYAEINYTLMSLPEELTEAVNKSTEDFCGRARTYINQPSDIAKFEATLNDEQKELMSEWPIVVFDGEKCEQHMKDLETEIHLLPIDEMASAADCVGEPALYVNISKWNGNNKNIDVLRACAIMREGVSLEQMWRGDLVIDNITGNVHWKGEMYEREACQLLAQETAKHYLDENPEGTEEDTLLETELQYPWLRESYARMTAGMAHLCPDAPVKTRLRELCDEWAAEAWYQAKQLVLVGSECINAPFLCFPENTKLKEIREWIELLFQCKVGALNPNPSMPNPVVESLEEDDELTRLQNEYAEIHPDDYDDDDEYREACIILEMRIDEEKERRGIVD